MVISTSQQQQESAYQNPLGPNRTVALKSRSFAIGGTRASVRSNAIPHLTTCDCSQDSSSPHQHPLVHQAQNPRCTPDHNMGGPTTKPAIPLQGKDDDESKKRRRRRKFNLKTHLELLVRTPQWQKGGILLLAIWFVLSTVGMARRAYRQSQGEQLPPPQQLDFLVAGFPKSGTTTLLAALHDHPEVAMDDIEYCQIARPIQQDDVNLKRLNRYLFALKNAVAQNRTIQSRTARLAASPSSLEGSVEPSMLKAGIKCPDAVKNFKAIHRLSQHSPDCRFVIGMRHPLKFVQSFYNYRLVEAQKLDRLDQPSLSEIWDSNLNWWDVSPDAPRYEMFLAQFGKLSVSLDELKEWYVERPMLAVKPNKFKIFVYSIEQIQDPVQSAALRKDLQSFLGLSKPIRKFGHENKLDPNVKKIPNHIDICSSEYSLIRQDILHHAQDTVAWMHEFLKSPDVVVTNRQSLIDSINKWTTDPCKDASLAATSVA
mmetsp:Transcript_3037/g.8589  ORF Transcript_3037/g.8589 Transcript_3037/m.8589 type:complete len:484 (+) Transcript_3037:233-1684(+)